MATKKPTLSLADASPEYARIQERLRELAARDTELTAEARGEHAAFAAARAAPRIIVPPATPKVSPGAAKLLAGMPGTVAAATPAPEEDEGTLKRRAARETERAEIREASDILRAALAAERTKASAAICDRVRPEYAAAVKAFAASLIEAGNRYLDYLAFTEGLQAADVAWSQLTPLMWERFGDPRDPMSAVRLYLAEMVGAGYLTERDLPAAWTR